MCNISNHLFVFVSAHWTHQIQYFHLHQTREISGILLSYWIELIFNDKNCSASSRCKEIHPSEHQKCNCRVLQILNPTPFPLSFSCPLPLAQQCSLSLHQLPSPQEDYLCRSLQPSGTIMQSHLRNRRGPLPLLENPPFNSEASL